MNSQTSNSKVAIDIQDLTSETILDALLEQKAEVFRSSRGRKTLLVGQAALNELKRRFSLQLDEGFDGQFILRG